MKKFILYSTLALLFLTNICFASAPLVIIMLGAPGAGKGTHSMRLSHTLGLPHISIAELLCDHVKESSPIGQKVKECLETGQLTPDDLILQALYKRLDDCDCQRGYILDGFPLTLAQAAALRDHLEGKASVVVFHLNVPDEVIVSRIEGRQICKNCCTPYNLKTYPPKVEGKCDKCNSDLYQRPDDIADVVKEKLRLYHEQTEPLVIFYQVQGNLYHVDSQKTMENVYEQLIQTVYTAQSHYNETAASRTAKTSVPQ